jgi:hypothetical protein
MQEGTGELERVSANWKNRKPSLPGFDPAIQCGPRDGRIKSGHDEVGRSWTAQTIRLC